MNSQYGSSDSSRLGLFFKVCLFAVVLLLFTRMIDLQIIKGAYYRSLSEDNRLRSVVLEAPRGKIYARGGEVLADNKEVKKVIVFDPENGYVKKIANKNILSEESVTEWDRVYPLGPIFSHAVGYLGEVNINEAEKPNAHCLGKGTRTLQSEIGRSGLEEQYDCKLRGTDGKKLVEVDIKGKKIRNLGEMKPIVGEDLNTTIDFGLQKKLSESFKDLTGAAVATDAQGQVLALYSNPSFNPSVFLTQNPTNGAIVKELFKDPNLPLFNRAISGAYHPGSVFKIVIGTAGLEEGIITPDFLYKDVGSVSVNGFNFSTWYFSQYGKTEGEITLQRAIARSTDTFFYKLGEMVGIDNLVSWGDKFGAGKKTGIDLPGETAGLLPSPAWKKEVLNERWFLGNTYHFSIGQGDTLMTPLQANMVTAAIGNGGNLCVPSLTFKSNSLCTKIGINKETLDTILKGMEMACEDGGTAYPFFDFKPQAACKTGTAETATKDTTHAWFTVFAPAKNPEIILTVLVENGGEGSKVAAPIAREALDYWFSTKPK